MSKKGYKLYLKDHSVTVPVSTVAYKKRKTGSSALDQEILVGLSLQLKNTFF
jgi:hypothetical protein